MIALDAIGSFLDNQTDESFNKAHDAAMNADAYLQQLAETFSSLPSVQLFVADNYAVLQLCKKASLGYATVEGMPSALPSEVAYAIAQKRCVASPKESKQHSVFLPESKWDSVLSLIRMMTAAPHDQHLQLIIAGMRSGTDFAGAYSPPEIIIPRRRPVPCSKGCNCDESEFAEFFIK